MNYAFAHTIDRLLGIPLCRLLSLFQRAVSQHACSASDSPNVGKIAIVKFWGMGSLILMIPALREFRKTHPKAEITLVTLAQNRELVNMIPEIDACETLDLRGGFFSFFFQTVSLLFRLRRRKFQLLYDLEFFTCFSSLFSYFSGAKLTFGFYERQSSRGHLHDVLLPFNSYWHVSDIFHHALMGRGRLPELPAFPWLSVPDDARRRVLELAGERAASVHRIVINPNAGPLAEERRWPPGMYRQLVEKLLREGAGQVILIGGPGEEHHVNGLMQGIPENLANTGRLVNLAGKLSLTELAALLASASVLVTNDSGPLHLAVGLGIPTVSLFGPETPVLYGPRGSRHRILFRDLPCSPCINVYKNKELWCRHGQNRCLAEITVEEVSTAVADVLKMS